MTAFSTLGLSAPLIQALSDQGYVSPSPVQVKVIPLVLQGRDLFAAAQTGTGKTASFGLPILQRLSATDASATGGVRALVLAPTRELAAQVEERISAYGRGLPLRSLVVHGGVPMEPQVSALQQGVDILVATPGRLLDLLYQGVLTLDSLETLVLDEADRMLDLGFIDEVQNILDRLPAQRQNLLFSATFSTAVVELAEAMTVNPARIEISRANSAADLVDQSIYAVEWDDKPDTVRYLVQEGRWPRALVFIRTKKSADDLVDYLLSQGIAAAAIHSNKSQILRTRTLAAFKSGEIQVLVATDIAARGLDIAELPLVINYDLPRVAQDYVHRIGRSGRAGQEGRAMSLLSGSERKWLAGIETLLHRRLNTEPLPFYDNGVEQIPDDFDPGVADSRNRSGKNARKHIKAVKAKSFKKKRNVPVKPGSRTPLAQPAKNQTSVFDTSAGRGSANTANTESNKVSKRANKNATKNVNAPVRDQAASLWAKGAKSSTKPKTADRHRGRTTNESARSDKAESKQVKKPANSKKPGKARRPLPFSGKK